MEADTSRANGPGIPLSEADQPYRRVRGGTSDRRRNARGHCRGRSGSVEGREGRGTQGAQGAVAAPAAIHTEKEGQEVGGQSGAEDSSVRISAGLQQSVEVALVRQ